MSNIIHSNSFFLNGCQSNLNGFCLKQEIDFVFEGKKEIRLNKCSERDYFFCSFIDVKELPPIPNGTISKQHLNSDQYTNEFDIPEQKQYAYPKRMMNKFGAKEKVANINKIPYRIWGQMKRELRKERLKLKLDQDESIIEITPHSKGLIAGKMGKNFFYAKCSFCNESNLIPFEMLEYYQHYGCSHLKGFYNPETNEFIGKVKYNEEGNSNFVATNRLKFVFREIEKDV